VKNSWGSETDAVPGGLTAKDGTKKDANRSAWGIVDGSGKHTGYFWLSYYDKSIEDCETFVFDNDLDVDNMYATMYDYMPAECGFWSLDSMDEVSSANEFEAEANQRLVSVSTFTLTEGTRVDFDVYKLSGNTRNPEEGTKVASYSQTFAYKGFHRVNLPQPVEFAKGDRYSVVSTVTSVDTDGSAIYGVAAAQHLTRDSAIANGSATYGVAVVNPGESFLKLGDNWVDWADYQKTAEFAESVNDDGSIYCVDNFAIKAYAVPK